MYLPTNTVAGYPMGRHFYNKRGPGKFATGFGDLNPGPVLASFPNTSTDNGMFGGPQDSPGPHHDVGFLPYLRRP